MWLVLNKAARCYGDVVCRKLDLCLDSTVCLLQPTALRCLTPAVVTPMRQSGSLMQTRVIVLPSTTVAAMAMEITSEVMMTALPSAPKVHMVTGCCC